MTTVVATIGRVTCRTCGEPCELSGCPCAYPPVTDTSRGATIKRIKTALQQRSGREWSVKGGKGTAYGWLRISVPPKRLGCAQIHEYDWQTNQCANCPAFRFSDGLSRGCPGHVCADTCYRNYMTPEDRQELASLLGKDDVHFQGESIPSGGDYYVEYIDRAEGRTPRKYGQQYWD